MPRLTPNYALQGATLEFELFTDHRACIDTPRQVQSNLKIFYIDYGEEAEATLTRRAMGRFSATKIMGRRSLRVQGSWPTFLPASPLLIH